MYFNERKQQVVTDNLGIRVGFRLEVQLGPMIFSLEIKLELNKEKEKFSPILFADPMCTSVNGKYFFVRV